MNPFSTDPVSNNDIIDPFSTNENNVSDPFSNNENNVSDPFSNNNNENILLFKNNDDIELWVADRGRKCDTYISHLPYTEAELLAHLKILKKKLGCGGSIQNSKEFESDELISEYFRIHIQGNHKNYINEYFTKLGIKNIKIKG